jgi:hypothetical protein
LRPELIDWSNTSEKVCPVEKGGVMLMKPSYSTAPNEPPIFNLEKSYI